MNIVNVGYNYTHPANFSINRPHGSGDYILLVLRTDAYFIFNSEKLVSPSDSVVIFKKGTPQFYGAISDEFANDWIHFNISKEEENEFKKLEIPFDTIIPINSVNVFSEFIKNIFCEKYSQNLYKEDSMDLYFHLLLRKLSEKIKSNTTEIEKSHFEELHKLRNKIQLSPQYNWNLNEICKTLHLSRSYIQHLYKNIFGVSIMADVLYGRIEYAKYLLSSTDFTIYNISDMCGYANDTHFMRLFKKMTGTTPSKYRENFKISKKELENSKSENPFCL